MSYNLWVLRYGPYSFLASLAFAIFAAPPLIEREMITGDVIEIFFLFILISGVFTVSYNNLMRSFILILVLLAAWARLTHKFDKSFFIASLDTTLAVITLFIFAILMSRQFLTKKSPLKLRIVAAVSIYLLIGLIWGRLFELTHLADPTAFNLPRDEALFSFIYFSFVTLVTIGYGDILPVSIVARNLAILEGVVGQLYTVIIISSLVSKFSSLAFHAPFEDNDHSAY